MGAVSRRRSPPAEAEEPEAEGPPDAPAAGIQQLFVRSGQVMRAFQTG